MIFPRRPLIMGIINVTPDSFSGDGTMLHADYVANSLAQAQRMLADGADILDIGGESTRPGSTPVSVDEEIHRIIPVIEAITAYLKNPQPPQSSPPLGGGLGWGPPQSLPLPLLSIDTANAATAAAALDAGAHIINDISGATRDPAMLPLAASRNAPIILMHNRSAAHAVVMREKFGGEYLAPDYTDVIEDVLADLKTLAANARAANIPAANIILDPGIGFGKNPAQNLRLINQLDRFKSLGYPILAGPSRKSFIGRILNLPPEERLEGTAACVAICTLRGADILRVHDVNEMSRVARMTAAITNQKQ